MDGGVPRGVLFCVVCVVWCRFNGYPPEDIYTHDRRQRNTETWMMNGLGEMNQMQIQILGLGPETTACMSLMP